MMKHLKRIAAAAGLCVLAACATNPATGERQLTFMSQEQEAQIGAQQHGQVLQLFGGAYDDARLGSYVASIGGRIAQRTETPNAQFRFTVLDSPIVNAMALPGGYVYVTRGILALANDEAELASVIGHEIGHVTARHAATRHARGTLMGVLAAGAGAITGSETVAQLANVGAAAAIASYSRDQEYQADALGVRYISRTGYDPFGSPRFLGQLSAQERVKNKMAGKDGRDTGQDFFASHPSSPERVKRAQSLASQSGAGGGGTPNRDQYLAMIDGMVYGDSPEEGFIRDHAFLHPVLRIGFEVPQGWVIQNSSAAVLARDPAGKGAVQFDTATVDAVLSNGAYITQVWGKGMPVEGLQDIRTNGMNGATAIVQKPVQGGTAVYRLTVVRVSATQLYRFLALAAAPDFSAMDKSFRWIVGSFRQLSASEAAELKPYRLRVATVQSGETVSDYARRMSFLPFAQDQFLLMNALPPNARLQAGQKVKFVSQN